MFCTDSLVISCRWCCRSSDVFKRDDEKEVERKARARKARETRRSTQVSSSDDDGSSGGRDRVNSSCTLPFDLNFTYFLFILCVLLSGCFERRPAKGWRGFAGGQCSAHCGRSSARKIYSVKAWRQAIIGNRPTAAAVTASYDAMGVNMDLLWLG